MHYTRITGTGSYLPVQIFTNQDWEKRVETTHEWIVERTGIHSRHIANPDETAAFMGAKAAQKALEMANVKPQQVQMIIVATATPDKIFPSTACLIQKKLSIPAGIAFDIQAACTGFIYALSIADQYIKSGAIDCALVIGAELMSKVMDWSDRNTCVLFGDGAGAVVLQKSNDAGILATDLSADGQYDDILYLNNPQLISEKAYLQMQGQKVFKIAVTKLGEIARAVHDKYKIKPEEIDWLIPHQANVRIIKATAEKLGLPMEKVILTVETHSNTSSASIPLALDVAVRDGRVQKGQTLLLEAFGAGLTWGTALVKF